MKVADKVIIHIPQQVRKINRGGNRYGKKELALMYMFVGLAFAIKGSGDWSLDSFLRK